MSHLHFIVLDELKLQIDMLHKTYTPDHFSSYVLEWIKHEHYVLIVVLSDMFGNAY